MTLMSICICVPFAEMDWLKMSWVKIILTNHVLIWNSTLDGEISQIIRQKLVFAEQKFELNICTKDRDYVRKDLPQIVGGRVPRLNLSNSIALIWYFPMYSANIGCAMLLIILQIAWTPKRKYHWRIIQQEHDETQTQMESLKYRV